MPGIVADLISDTQTRPSPGMRQAMAAAEVGDEQQFEDPTTNRLQDMVAELLGQEAAVFLPSGTMCNEIAFAVHCAAGDLVFLEETAHMRSSEAGGPAVIARCVLQPIAAPRGVFTPTHLDAALVPRTRYTPRPRLVSVEQTTNWPGGTCWTLAEIEAVCAWADSHGLRKHCDGARLLNAVVASGTPAAAFAGGFDSVWIDMSKGLGAPVGAVLAGSREFIDEAWRWKQRMGGAMRQSGVIAAAGIYALEHNVERLAEDHANARFLAEGLAQLPGLHIDPSSVETNIVFFELRAGGPDGAEFVKAARERGVRLWSPTGRRVRAVTHLDVTRANIDAALEVLADLLRG